MKDKLFLIDGHALIFKMYYAFIRRPMINSKGEDMSILFGVTKYILELIRKEEPAYIAVAFDPPGGTFRNKLYPAYKATRPATPQLVIDALEPLRQILSTLGIKTLMEYGYEADDVIGTVAKREAAAGLDVYMVTPDKDYGQLVGGGIWQVNPGKSGGEDEVLGEREICSKYGISSASQVIEMLTLCGDTADNVPGVKGLGEVGAAKLIAKYDSVANIYAHLSELTPRQQQQFRDAESHINLSHDLVTIKTDVGIQLRTDQMRLDMHQSPELSAIFDRYEFNSLRKYIPTHGNAVSQESCPTQDGKSIALNVMNVAQFLTAVKANGIVALGMERSGSIFSDLPYILLATCTPPEAANYGVSICRGNPHEFASILIDKNVAKYGLDLKYQMDVLHNNGIDVSGILMDVSLMHYLIDPEKSHKLDVLAKEYIGVDIDKADEEVEKDLFNADSDDKSLDTEVAAALLTGLKLREVISSSVAGRLYFDIEEPLVYVLSKMEIAGIKVDLGCLKDFAATLRQELLHKEAKIREMAGEPDLNISSPKQIGDLLFGKLSLDPKARKTANGRYPTDEATLSALSHTNPIVDEILDFRAVKKLLSTYIEPFPSYISSVTGRVHTTFNQALTATGRLSSSNPNLQNIPIRTEKGKEIRKAFVPADKDGYIVSADYSQIELRIMAHFSHDRHLIDAFRNGVDVHAATAAKIFGIPHEEVTADQRRVAKTANFGIMYGISAFGLSQRLGISRSEAKKIIDDYFAAFPSIKSFISDTIAFAKQHGYVETIFGRRRYLSDINSANANVRSLAERNAVNAPIQGTAADIIKMAMINVDKAMTEAGLRSRMVLQIHDELLFDTVHDEVSELVDIVKEQMEHVADLSVPLTVECNYGKNWLEAH